jgi:GGDEF domain-containing protein
LLAERFDLAIVGDPSLKRLHSPIRARRQSAPNAPAFRRIKKRTRSRFEMSVTDNVSGFNNTRYLHRYLDRFIGSPSAREDKLSLVFFDLDNFKCVVDKHGHLIGSKVLKEVAQAAHHVLDEDDRIVRYGGDEFVVVLPRHNVAGAPRSHSHFEDEQLMLAE